MVRQTGGWHTRPARRFHAATLAPVRASPEATPETAPPPQLSLRDLSLGTTLVPHPNDHPAASDLPETCRRADPPAIRPAGTHRQTQAVERRTARFPWSPFRAPWRPCHPSGGSRTTFLQSTQWNQPAIRPPAPDVPGSPRATTTHCDSRRIDGPPAKPRAGPRANPDPEPSPASTRANRPTPTACLRVRTGRPRPKARVSASLSIWLTPIPYRLRSRLFPLPFPALPGFYRLLPPLAACYRL